MYQGRDFQETDRPSFYSGRRIRRVVDQPQYQEESPVETSHHEEDESVDEDSVNAPKLMRVRDFKRLLASLGNKMISYAYVGEEDLYFDFFLYCKEMGIDLKTKTSKSGEIKSIQLIFPEGREKQNEKSSSSNVQ